MTILSHAFLKVMEILLTRFHSYKENMAKQSYNSVFTHPIGPYDSTDNFYFYIRE